MVQLIMTGLIIGAVVIVFAFDGDISNLKPGKKSEKNKKKSNTSNLSTGKVGIKGKKIKNSQDNLSFQAIRTVGGHDGPALIVKNENSYVGVLEIEGVNFNLLSISEKLILEDVFQKTLNGIDYPIQIYIQSRKINLDSYNSLYKKRIEEITDLLKTEQRKFTRLTDRNAEFEELQEVKNNIDRISSQINYGESVINFINKFAANDDILDKRYFISVPYYYDSSAFNQEQTNDEKFQTALNTVLNRLESILSSLNGAGMSGRVLNGLEMAELLYNSYNKPDADKYKLSNAVKSGFSNYITTSRPVEYKIIDEEKKKIEKEYKKKIEDLKSNPFIDTNFDNENIEEKVV